MPIKSLSQRGKNWSSINLGFSASTTIGSHGCTITCVAMLAGLNPDEVNSKLKSINGYANTNLIIWSKIQEAIPHLKFEWRSYFYDNAKVASAIKKNGGCLVEVSGKRIGGSKHWVLFIGNKQMIDPWTGSIKSTSWYGTPTGYAEISVIGQPNQPDQPNCIPQEELDKMRTERDKNWSLYQEEKKIREEIYNELQGEKEKSKQLKAHLQQVASALGSPSDNIEDILSAIKINEDEAEKNRKTAKELEKAMDILKKENKDEKDDLRRQINELKLINEKQAQHINTLEARLDNLEDKNETTKRIKLIIEKILNIFKKGK